jgi:uncharacterized protein DUF6894
MPRYFFNVFHETSNIDTVGEELPDDETAWREATVITGELVRELSGRFRPGQQWRMEVMDEAKELLYLIWLTGHRAR